MSIAYHCDREGCDTWTHTHTHSANHFLTLRSSGRTWHFCTEDCLMRWSAAKSAPTEDYPL